jgi:hypothetical protein
MPHEVKGIQDLPHEFLTYILTTGAVVGLLLFGLVGYLRWKARRGSTRTDLPSGAGRRRQKRKRR